MSSGNIAAPAIGSTPTPSPGWIRKLLGEAWRYRRIVVVTMIVTMLAVAVDIVMPLLAKGAIDRATGVIDDDLALSTIITGLVVLAFVRYACHFGRRVFAGRLAINVQNNLRRRLLDTLLHLDGRSQHQIRTGQIVSRSISDIQVVQGLLAMAPLSMGAAVQMVFLLLKTWSYVVDFITVVLYLLFVEIIPAYFILYEDIRHSRKKSKALSMTDKADQHDQNSDEIPLPPSMVTGASRDSLSGSISD